MTANNFSLKSSAKVVWFKRGVAASVLVGFTWLIVSAISSNVEDENLEPALVKAPEMVKQRPETPGGMKIDHQDKQLFDLLESETSTNDVADSVLAKAKDLENKNAQLSAQAIEKKELAEKLAQAKQQEELAKAKAEQAARAAAELERKTAALKAQAAKKAETVEVKKEQLTEVKQQMAVTKKEIKKEVKELKAEVAKAQTTGWAVQLGSFRKTADAERAVGVYNKKVGNILVGLNPYVKKADLGAKGTVYRVYFTGLKDKEHAKQICNQLKAQKQACLRAKL